MAKTKILVNLWEPLVAALRHKIDAACLKRDDYLDHVLRHEAGMVVKEVGGRNSDEVRAYIAQNLNLLRRKQVNLNLSEETVQAINEACQRVNMPRDAFINRVVLLLVSQKPFFKRLLTEIDWDWAESEVVASYYDYFDPVLDCTLTAIGEMVTSDPFAFYRACIELVNKDGGTEVQLHAANLQKDFLRHPEGSSISPESAIGFNCYVSEYEIEGHPAQTALQDSLLGQLLGWDNTKVGKGDAK